MACEIPVRIGVSSCLLGEEVRFDGGHKKDAFLAHELARHVEWAPVCPELEVGMGVPREAVRLIQHAGSDDERSTRMVGTKSGKDWTEAMRSFSQARVKSLEKLRLSGYVLKSKSPSCGKEGVKAYSPSGRLLEKNDQGLFAKALMEHFPLLPVEEEGRLGDPLLRENFIERVFCYHRWLLLRDDRLSARKLQEFHGRHKFLLQAHSERHLRELGRIVAKTAEKGRRSSLEAADEYAKGFFEALKVVPTRRKHVNVLQHIAGFFKKRLDSLDREGLRDAIEDYRRGLVPRLVPQTLILQHSKRFSFSYVEEQFYLSPHPKELALKYHG